MITRAVKLVEDNAIESAVRTISMERAGLAALEDALRNGLSEPFCKAIETIGQSNGRLIITGVGKSGHIGAKLASRASRCRSVSAMRFGVRVISSAMSLLPCFCPT